jgi:hypothetical protein
VTGLSFLCTALLMDFLNTEEKRERRLVHLPMGRFGEAVELARAALFCAYHRLPLVSVHKLLMIGVVIFSGQR